LIDQRRHAQAAASSLISPRRLSLMIRFDGHEYNWLGKHIIEQEILAVVEQSIIS